MAEPQAFPFEDSQSSAQSKPHARRGFKSLRSGAGLVRSLSLLLGLAAAGQLLKTLPKPPAGTSRVDRLFPERNFPQRTFLDRLREQAGGRGPLAALPSPQGLILCTPEGTLQRIGEGPVPWVLVDNRSSVVWFSRSVAGGTEIYILDLLFLGNAPAPVLIATAPRGKAGFQIHYPSEEGWESLWEDTRPLPARFEFVIALMVTEQGYRFADEALYLLDPRPNELLGPEQVRTVSGRAQLAPDGADVLRRLARRGWGRSVSLPRPPSQEVCLPHVPVPEKDCDYEGCGEASPVVGSPYWKVITTESGGCVVFSYSQLYDPRTQEFFRLDEPLLRSPRPLPSAFPTEAFAGGFVAPDGSAIIHGGAIVRFAGGHFSAGGGIGGGWIGGQWHNKR